MAGIGWRLERLMHRGVSGAVTAYATGAAVMALPWILTTAVLASLPMILGQGKSAIDGAETVVNVAMAVALLVAGPIQIVLSRYAADRLYDGRVHAIEAPLCRGMAATFILCAIPALLVLLTLGLPIRSAVWGAALAAAVGAQWTALSVGNGLCSPALVLGAVCAGSVLSFGLAAFLVAVAGLGVPGYLLGLIMGQCLSLAMLLAGILRSLPLEAYDRARLLPSFRDYALLAGAGLAFNASLWVDKLIAWRLAGSEAAALHTSASTLAWFSAIPCLAWVFVEVETRFHRQFQAFYRELEGGASLPELGAGVRSLLDETSRLLRGAASVQLGVTAFLQLAADPLARWMGTRPEAVVPFRWLLVGAGAQSLGLLGLILLYYFDLRREACFAASGLLLAIASCTLLASGSNLPPSLGTALGCLLGAALVWQLVFRGVSAVLEHTLLGQPYAPGGGQGRIGSSERRGGPAPLAAPSTGSQFPRSAARARRDETRASTESMESDSLR